MIAVFEAVTTRWSYRSVSALKKLEINLPRLMTGWVIIACLMCGLRAGFGAIHKPDTLSLSLSLLVYMPVIIGPPATLWFCLNLFPKNTRYAQPMGRLVQLGRWRPVGWWDAAQHPQYGATGIMFSLLVGMLLNVPVRTIEFLCAIPPIDSHMPHWFILLFAFMLLDVVVLSCLYVTCFVAALRHVPLFPRMIIAVWAIDLGMQVIIGNCMSHMTMPHQVEVALDILLKGNMKKVMISAALWLPYLLWSRRVNITYRQRERA